MSKSSAKKKRRRRARPAGGAAAGAGAAGAKARGPAGAKASGPAGAKASGPAGAKASGAVGAKRRGPATPTAGAAKRSGAAGAKAGPPRGGAKDGRAAGAKGGRAAASKSRGATKGAPAARPDAIWAPFPLTEIGMAAGLVIFGTGYATKSTWLLSIGALLLAVVVGELCLREHLSGFRSHVLLLTALSVVGAHSVVVLAISDTWKGPIALAVDLALGGALAWWLRGRYRIARERTGAS